jgi:hypothetical protein
MSWNQVQSLAAHLYAWFQTAESNEDYLMRWLAGCGALALSLASIKFGWKFTKGTCKGCRWTWRLVFPKGELSEFGKKIVKQIGFCTDYENDKVKGCGLVIYLESRDQIYWLKTLTKPCGKTDCELVLLDRLLTNFDKSEIVRLAKLRKDEIISVENERLINKVIVDFDRRL